MKKPDSLEINTGGPDGQINNTPLIAASFTGQEKTQHNWLNLEVGCYYNDGKIPLKQLANQSPDVIEYVKETIIHEKRGYMRVTKSYDGVRSEKYFFNLEDGRIFDFTIFYPTGSSFLQTARTILATVILK